MSEEKFCLKWNDFESSLSRSFKELRCEAELFDVWLCSETGEREVAAHRLVLSACSGVLRHLLRRKRPGPGSGPAPGVVYLRGVAGQDLQNIVNFMYDGEVSIAQDQLNSFLAAAEDLQIKGLTQDKSKPSQSESKKPSIPVKKPSSFLTPAPVSKFVSKDDDEIEEIAVPIKHEPFSGPSSANTHNKASASQLVDYHDPGEGGGEYGDMGDVVGYEEDETFLDPGYQTEGAQGNKAMIRSGIFESEASIDSMFERREDGEFICIHCGYSNRAKQNMQKHVETHVQGPGHVCRYCYKTFKTTNSLQTHTSVKHRAERERQGLLGHHI